MKNKNNKKQTNESNIFALMDTVEVANMARLAGINVSTDTDRNGGADKPDPATLEQIQTMLRDDIFYSTLYLMDAHVDLAKCTRLGCKDGMEESEAMSEEAFTLLYKSHMSYKSFCEHYEIDIYKGVPPEFIDRLASSTTFARNTRSE